MSQHICLAGKSGQVALQCARLELSRNFLYSTSVDDIAARNLSLEPLLGVNGIDGTSCG